MDTPDGKIIYTVKTTFYRSNYDLEVNDGHLLIIFVNNETFTEEDVFDIEFSFTDDNTLSDKDSFGEELTYIRQ